MSDIEFVIESTIMLSEIEVFPDGVPDHYDADDVAEIARKYRSVTRWLEEWNLTRDVEVRVYVDGDSAPVFR